MSKAKRKSNVFQEELLNGEEILWMDKPPAWKLLNLHDVILIPITLLWGGFMTFWASYPIRTGLPFSLIGLIFVIYGLHAIFGRFIVKYLTKRNTYYAATNMRVLIANRFIRHSFQAIPIETLPALEKSIGLGGIGTITFGLEPKRRWWDRNQMNLTNTGMDFMGYRVTGLYDIRNAHAVYRLISEVRQAYTAQAVEIDEDTPLERKRERRKRVMSS